jgi:hypothetical protein
MLAIMVLSMALLLLINSVKCSPGISITIEDVDAQITGSGDTATYVVSVESITTEDENVRLAITGDAGLAFNWTSEEFMLAQGTTESYGLEATYSNAGSGKFAFTASGEAWPTWLTYEEAAEMGLIETSSFTAYVYVLLINVIPEVPLGTIAAGGSMMLALAVFIAFPHSGKHAPRRLRRTVQGKHAAILALLCIF